jgi:type IX secretion system PorP/SprF family membrane protein
MKKILAVLTLGCISVAAFAQQDPQFSQNMFNRLYVNPAYAGSSEAICAHLLYRSQWVSFEGAPKTGVIGIDLPFANNKAGAGLSISTDKLGYESTLEAKLAGTYRFDIGSGKLGLGLDFDFLQNSINGKDLNPVTPNDPAIPAKSVNGTGYDLGGGLYYSSDKLYFGLSASHLLETKVKMDDFEKKYTRHIYGMIGYSFDVTPSVALKPSVFIKTTQGNTTFDVNVNAHFNNRFWLGVSYRNEKLRVGYSYDFTTSKLKNYSDGTHEIMLGYCFTVKKKITPVIKNVRYL